VGPETQSIQGKCHGQAKPTGVGRYDTKAGRLLSLVWVFDDMFAAPAPDGRPARA
jgi:hypothetical protein